MMTMPMMEGQKVGMAMMEGKGRGQKEGGGEADVRTRQKCNSNLLSSNLATTTACTMLSLIY